MSILTLQSDIVENDSGAARKVSPASARRIAHRMGVLQKKDELHASKELDEVQHSIMLIALATLNIEIDETCEDDLSEAELDAVTSRGTDKTLRTSLESVAQELRAVFSQ
jgi:hypothetical protein